MANNLPEEHDVVCRMRQMVVAYPCDTVMIGETHLRNTAGLDQWYGGSEKDELAIPTDMMLGLSNKLDAQHAACTSTMEKASAAL